MKKLISVLLAAAMCLMPIAVQAENTSIAKELEILTDGKTVKYTISNEETVLCSIKPKEDTVYVIYSSSSSEKCDPFATLYDDEYNEIAKNDDTDEGYDFKIKVLLHAGKEYFLEVEFYSWDTAVNTIDITFEKAEKDYLTASATELKLDTPVNSTLKNDECNYYEFTPEEDGYYNFYSTHEDFNEIVAQLYYVYDDVMLEMDDCDSFFVKFTFWGYGISETVYLDGGKTYVLEVFQDYYLGYENCGDCNYAIAVTQNSQERSNISAETIDMGLTEIKCENKSVVEEKYYSITPTSDIFCYITSDGADWNAYEVIIGSLVECGYSYPIILEKDKEYIIAITAYSDVDIYLTEDALTLTPIDGCEYDIEEDMRTIKNIDARTTASEFKANFVEEIKLIGYYSGELLEDDDLIYPGIEIRFVVDGRDVATDYYAYINQLVPEFKEDSEYTFDEEYGCIYGIKEGTTVAEFKENFEDALIVYDYYSDEKLAANALVTTGIWVEMLLDGVSYETYWEIFILGDVNCDGVVNSTDFIQIRKYYLGNFDFDCYTSYLAADTNGDGEINSTDFIRIRRHYLGSYNLYA